MHLEAVGASCVQGRRPSKLITDRSGGVGHAVGAGEEEPRPSDRWHHSVWTPQAKAVGWVSVELGSPCFGTSKWQPRVFESGSLAVARELKQAAWSLIAAQAAETCPERHVLE